MATQRNNYTLRSLYDEFVAFRGSVTIASIATGASASTAVTVAGVALGDQVLAFSLSVDLAGLVVVPYVSAANTVTLRVYNGTGGTVNLGAATGRILVGKCAANAFAP